MQDCNNMANHDKEELIDIFKKKIYISLIYCQIVHPIYPSLNRKWVPCRYIPSATFPYQNTAHSTGDTTGPGLIR